MWPWWLLKRQIESCHQKRHLPGLNNDDVFSLTIILFKLFFYVVDGVEIRCWNCIWLISLSCLTLCALLLRLLLILMDLVHTITYSLLCPHAHSQTHIHKHTTLSHTHTQTQNSLSHTHTHTCTHTNTNTQLTHAHNFLFLSHTHTHTHKHTHRGEVRESLLRYHLYSGLMVWEAFGCSRVDVKSMCGSR